MSKKIIVLCYRKTIDATYSSLWEQYVHQDSFTEFKMQAQLFNPHQKYTTFPELIQHVPGSDKLHFLVSAAVTGYIQQLKGIVPDILDNLGRRFIAFEHFKFELINSDITDIQKHKVAINFFSKPLIWHETIGEMMLVSQNKESGEANALTNLFPIQPYLSVHSLTYTE